jgi:DNA-binding response OmpR family regulator
MKRILYVEDSSMAQQFMCRLLKELGEVSVIASLQSAEAVLKTERFDLLIADYLFPEGDALAFIRKVRESVSPVQLPIIIVSGSMDRLLVSQVLKAGANDAFAKPLNVDEFKAAVNRMLTHAYVRSDAHGLIGVCCFQWTINDKYYQFCPELGLIVSELTKESASSRMFEALKKQVALGAVLGGIANERSVTHIIDMP